MGILSSLVVLSTYLVITLSLPRPDGEYAIPEVGTGERSQYYILHSDGTFKYGYDTGDGAFESAKLKEEGHLKGVFGYKDPDGNDVELEYKAGVDGFLPFGNHLPRVSNEFEEAFAAARLLGPFEDPLAKEDSDASYNFAFESDVHSRSETADSDGNVHGQYTYVDSDGNTRLLVYKAGKGIGFVIESDEIIPGEPQTLIAADISGEPLPTFKQAADKNFVSSTSGSEISNQGLAGPLDASYSFFFDAGDHSRSETSDSKLNVKGDFSFVADDGEKRTITYIAGPDTGFVAEGDHLPVVPDSNFGVKLPIALKSGDRQSVVPILSVGSHRSAPEPTPFKILIPSLPESRESPIFEEANIKTSQSSDGSYSFSYETSDHSRSENSDSDNKVTGSFTYEVDGQKKEITYEAGSGIGFVAKGEHLPVAPVVPVTRFLQSSVPLTPVAVTFEDPLANPDLDASYNFNFDSDTYSRQENADSTGNIEGTYTVTENGVKTTYKYSAGKGIGYKIIAVSSENVDHPEPITISLTRSDNQDTEGYVIPSPIPQARVPLIPVPIQTVQFDSNGQPEFSDVKYTIHQYSRETNPDKFGYVLKFD